MIPIAQLKVDFWIVKDEFNKQEIKRAVAKIIDGQKVNFISPEDLVLSKLLWYKESNSTRQLEDVQSVLAVTKVDLKHIRNWAEKQGTIEILEKLIKEIA
mgnify:FL=1